MTTTGGLAAFTQTPDGRPRSGASDKHCGEPNNARVSKRRLSRQQTRRIASSQRQRAARADAPGADSDNLDGLGPEQRGRVVAQFGREIELRDDAGGLQRCFLRANLDTPVAGDTVVFRSASSGAVVVATEPRRSELTRPDRFGKLRVIAANIDRVVIVLAPVPQPHSSLIDRYLVACEHLGAEAILLVNKTDLLHEDAHDAVLQELLSPYPALGYRVLRGAARESVPGGLAQALSGHTSILVGQSGVGKTTLLNALLPEAAQRVGELSEERGKGRHTTTTARLFELPCGGSLIDSPGIREFGLWHLERSAIDAGFREIRRFAADCRFRDCRHGAEPGCAVTAARDAGQIHPARWDSYQRILGELEKE